MALCESWFSQANSDRCRSRWQEILRKSYEILWNPDHFDVSLSHNHKFHGLHCWFFLGQNVLNVEKSAECARKHSASWPFLRGVLAVGPVLCGLKSLALYRDVNGSPSLGSQDVPAGIRNTQKMHPIPLGSRDPPGSLPTQWRFPAGNLLPCLIPGGYVASTYVYIYINYIHIYFVLDVALMRISNKLKSFEIYIIPILDQQTQPWILHISP